MYKPHPESLSNITLRERGQGLIEYALITVLVGIAFGLAMAASAPVTGNLFNAVVNDMLRQTVVGDVPNPDEFWGTVTGVYQNTPAGAALPTNTKAPPTAVPTDGPSPTPTETYTPSPTAPTSTPTMTRTPVDILKNAPFLDTVDQPQWWRIDSNFALRGEPWRVQAWTNTTFSGTPAFTAFGVWDLKYNEGPFFEGIPKTNFSARFTRTFEVSAASAPRVVNFRVVADDGVLMKLNGSPVSLVNGAGTAANFTQKKLDLYTGTATLPEGTHEIVVEYKNTTDPAVLRVEISGGNANPDDTAIDASGSSSADSYSCNWGVLEHADDANTRAKLFDDYAGGLNRAGTLCYLEFRGAVVIPADATDMQMHFWDVWEFGNNNVDGWLEVAEYVPNSTIPTVDRDTLNWETINLGRAGTANYNWTHNVYDLGPSWAGKNVAFRFVMKVGHGVTTGVKRQWYIDDIEFKRKTEKVFTVDRIWTLNNANERFDFIRSGGMSNSGLQSGWHLVSNNKFGPNGLAFHDSVNEAIDDAIQVAGANSSGFTQYRRMSLSPSSNLTSEARIHSLEFDGWIDLSNVPVVDSLGNSGEPVLSFYHAYHLGKRTGLSVQYSISPYGPTPATWTTFPGGGGMVPIDAAAASTSLTMQEHVISLSGLPGNPQRIRIRFAMLIRGNAEYGDGWWIDQIRLGRAESNKWLNYPFFDDAQGEGPLYLWRYTGLWAPSANRGHYRTNALSDDVEMSYASSPQSNYANSQTTYLTMRWPIDLYNDTPDKQVIVQAGAVTQPSNTFGAPATSNSVLTFYHWRELHQTDSLRVEWKRSGEADSDYRLLWIYRHGMKNTATERTTGVNRAWQYARVSLYPIFKQFTTDNNGAPGVGTGNQLTDDDIVIRFGLHADNSSNRPGVYIDDIQLEESNMRTVRLWPNGENRVDPSLPVSPPPPLLGNGTGSYFFSEPDGTFDGRAYTLDWKMGGQWQPQRFEKRKGSGMFAFHDSVSGGQDAAPSGYATKSDGGSPDYGSSSWRSTRDSFAVLDLNREFDLRAVVAETESPQLSFWTRYHIATGDFIRVEVSTWDNRTDSAIDSSMSARCAGLAVLQCYEQERGWGQWTPTAWSVGSANAETMSYGWHRVSVDLRPYAYSSIENRAGTKIRIRFVYDSYSDTTKRDGWYIDGVEMSHRLPLGTTAIESAVWIDQARSTSNWITEGSWGLDENIFLASGSTPVSLGNWTGRWWHCPSSSPTLLKDCEQRGYNVSPRPAAADRFKVGADLFLKDPLRPDPDGTASYSSINLDFGGGKPYPPLNASDEVLAEFTIDITVDGYSFQPGKRSFSTRSDDGVRLKIEELDDDGVPKQNSPIEWNIINNWTDHPAVTDSGITPEDLGFLLNKRYRLTLQYYEKSGNGVIQLTASAGSFSFSDSPKTTGGGTPDVPPIPRANTSLLGRHIFDLTGFGASNVPVLEIHTKYRIHGSASANVEVSPDGGFTWSQTGLSSGAFGIGFSGPTWNGITSNFDTDPDNSDWQIRLFNLNNFEGRHVIIRMRFDRISTSCSRNTGDCRPNNPAAALRDGYYDGWWIGFMRMGNSGS